MGGAGFHPSTDKHSKPNTPDKLVQPNTPITPNPSYPTMAESTNEEVAGGTLFKQLSQTPPTCKTKLAMPAPEVAEARPKGTLRQKGICFPSEVSSRKICARPRSSRANQPSSGEVGPESLSDDDVGDEPEDDDEAS